VVPIFIRVVVGYIAAVTGATIALVLQLALITQSKPVGGGYLILAVVLIGIFGWSGLIVGFLGVRRGWSRALTYALGGVLAMLIGVLTMFAWTTVNTWDKAMVVEDPRDRFKDLANLALLIGFGIVPGIAGGLTYWMIAAPRPPR
jgi:energy-converting hydrogenase Eha subunit A